MQTIIISVIAIGILIFVHELGHFLMAKLNGIRVETFSLGFGPKICSYTWRETRYQLAAVPLGGYVKMAGEEPDGEKNDDPGDFYNKKPWQRVLVIAAGPVMNLLLAYFIFSGLFFSGLQTYSTTIGTLMEGYPAEQAGLMQGDKILSIDGTEVTKWDDMVALIHKHADQSLAFAVRRDGIEFTVGITPRAETLKDPFGKEHTIGLVGITPGNEFVVQHHSLLESLALAADQTVFITAMTYKGFWAMVTGKISKKDIGGPIMIAQMAGQQAKAGWLNLLSFIALISINLGVLNLIPIPILDGGQILFILVEKIKGSPVHLKAQEWAMKISFAVLIGLMVAVSFNDIWRIASPAAGDESAAAASTEPGKYPQALASRDK